MKHRRPVRRVALGSLATAAMITIAPPAAADPEADLAVATNELRRAAHCPALQVDPVVTRVAALASRNTSDYVGFRTAAVPFTDPGPALTTLGYRASKAVLFSGYGRSAADALRGATLHYRAAKPDCSYTRYGVSALHDDAGFDIASIVLATP